MATLLELSAANAIYKIDPGLDPGQQEFRVFYASLRLKDWIENVLPSLASLAQLEESPLEQFDALMGIYGSDEILAYERQFKPLYPRENGTWELKTQDIRIFGWFAQKDHFVGVVADEMWKIKEHRLYAGYIGEVVRFRDRLNLNAPKFVPGDDPNAVVSNSGIT